MRIFQSTFLTLDQKQSVFELWNLEYPDRIGYAKISDFENYLDQLLNKNHYLLIDDENQILGWTFTFFREDDIWFAIILNSKIQRKGYGRLLLEELKKNCSVLNAWVIDDSREIKQNKEPYISPLKFYLKNGFSVNPNIRIENEKISAIKIKWEKL